MSRHIIPGSRTRRTEGTQSKADRAGPWYQQFVCVSWMFTTTNAFITQHFCTCDDEYINFRVVSIPQLKFWWHHCLYSIADSVWSAWWQIFPNSCCLCSVFEEICSHYHHSEALFMQCLNIQSVFCGLPSFYYAPPPTIWCIKRWCASGICLSRTSGLSWEQSQWAGGLLSLAYWS